MGSFLIGLLGQIASLIAGGIGGAISMVTSLVKTGYDKVLIYNKEGMALAKTMGLNAKEAQAYTEVLISRAKELGKTYGIAAEQVIELQKNISTATNRQLMLNDVEAERMIQINQLVGSDVQNQFISEMMNGMGAQLSTVQGAVSKAYATAAKSGLNAQKVSEKIANNLSMANRLSFRNGINGLTRMAIMSEKLGINMQSVESAAMKFIDLDKAIENAAQMQMLGGSAAVNFGNPLTAAFEANYDPEAFAKRMSDSLASYATFDAKSGIANINGMNMDFVRAISQAMGISVDDASKMAKKNAEIKYKEGAFGSTLGRYGKEERDFILNKSYVENGRLMINDTNGRKIDIEREGISQSVLDEMRKFNSKSDRDIMEQQARSLISIEDKITGFETSFFATIAEGINNHIDDIYKVVQKIGEFATSDVAPKIAEGVVNLFKWFEARSDKFNELFDTLTKKSTSALGWIADNIVAIAGFLIGGKIFKWLMGMPWAKSTVGNALLSKIFNKGGAGSPAAARGGKLGTIARNKLNGAKIIFKDLGSYGKYVKSNYQIRRAAGDNIFKAAFKGMKGPSVAANGSIMNRGLNNPQIMGNVTSTKAKSLAARGIMRGASTAGKLLKGGGVGILGTLGNIGTDYLVNNKKIETGGAAHTAMKVGSTAAEFGALGAAIGSFIPGLGTAIGGAIGGAIGAGKGYYGSYKQWKEDPKNQDKSFGDYASGQINGAFDWFSKKGNKTADAILAIFAPFTLIPKYWTEIGDGVKNAWSKVINGFSSVGEWFKNKWNGIGNGMSSVWKSFKSGLLSTMSEETKRDLKEALANVKAKWNNITQGISDSWNNFKNTISEGWNNTIQGISSLWNDYVAQPASKLWDGITNLWNDYVVQPASKLWDGIINLWNDYVVQPVSKLWDGITNLWNNYVAQPASKLWDGISNTWNKYIAEPIPKILNKIAEGAKEAWDFVTSPTKWVEAAGKGAGKILNFVSGHADGGIVGGNSYTGDKVLARVNSGEMILNSNQQSNLFAAINDLPTLISKVIGNKSITNTTSYSTVNPNSYSNNFMNNYSDNNSSLFTSVNPNEYINKLSNVYNALNTTSYSTVKPNSYSNNFMNNYSGNNSSSFTSVNPNEYINKLSNVYNTSNTTSYSTVNPNEYIKKLSNVYNTLNTTSYSTVKPNSYSNNFMNNYSDNNSSSFTSVNPNSYSNNFMNNYSDNNSSLFTSVNPNEYINKLSNVYNALNTTSYSTVKPNSYSNNFMNNYSGNNSSLFTSVNPSEYIKETFNDSVSNIISTYGDKISTVMPSVVSSVLVNKNDVKAKPVGEKEYIYTPTRNDMSNVNGNTITVKDFNINLGGTLKLDGGNGSKNIDMNALLNDFQFINSLKELIKASINNDMNGGRFMNDLATMRGQTSSFSILGR